MIIKMNARQLEIEKAKISTAIDAFAKEMKEKMYRKAAQNFHGWDDPGYYHNIADGYEKHFCKPVTGGNNYVDVANFAMMLWNIHKHLQGEATYREDWKVGDSVPNYKYLGASFGLQYEYRYIKLDNTWLVFSYCTGFVVKTIPCDHQDKRDWCDHRGQIERQCLEFNDNPGVAIPD